MIDLQCGPGLHDSASRSEAPPPDLIGGADVGVTAMRAEEIRWTMFLMAERIMFVQVKTGHNTDKGPAWISRVRFTKSGKTAYWRGKTLRRWPGMFDANFYDVETHEEYWLSGPHRDRADTRYSSIRPEIDDDVREAYEAFLRGAPLPGRARGWPGGPSYMSRPGLARLCRCS